jgi:UDPglucose 6-dehydrogenase
MFARRIAVIGSGYVGLSTGACLASLGHRMICADVDAGRIERQRRIVIDKIVDAAACSVAGRRIGLLRLTFKAGTNDLRDSPALAVARLLRAAGAEPTAYDPGCPAAVPAVTDDVNVVDEPLLAADDADALVVLTEWPEFRSLAWPAVAGALAHRVVVDTRNLLDPDVLCRAGISWVGVGRR